MPRHSAQNISASGCASRQRRFRRRRAQASRSTQTSASLELRPQRDQPPGAVQREGLAIEDQLVLRADDVAVQHRQAVRQSVAAAELERARRLPGWNGELRELTIIRAPACASPGTTWRS